MVQTFRKDASGEFRLVEGNLGTITNPFVLGQEATTGPTPIVGDPIPLPDPVDTAPTTQQVNTQNITAPSLPAGTEATATAQTVGTGETLTQTPLGSASQVQAPTAEGQAATAAAQVTADTIGDAVPQVDAAQGTVSADAQVTAAQDATAPVVNAAQGTIGTAIDAAQTMPSEEFIAEAAQGQASDDAIVTAATAEASSSFLNAVSSLEQEMSNSPVDPRATVREQYAQLMDFEPNEMPGWASGAMRAATQLLNKRGILGSTIAGEAVTAALMQAALPIASQDAQMFATWDLKVLDVKAQAGILKASHLANLDVQNLQNRQQAVLQNGQAALQFDLTNLNNEQQVRVFNAQQSLELAAQNTGFRQQALIENARNALTMDLSNLDAQNQAKIMNAQAALTVQTQNLNNRQQANIENARSFLNMDMTNLSNRQQAAIVNTQTRLQSMLSDSAAINAAANFNALSENQTNQFFAGLSQDINKFNSAQTLTADQFNAKMVDSRSQFNATNALIVDQANVQYLRQINTANTATLNQVNMTNATNLLNISNTAMANEIMLLRDENAQVWESSENALERSNRRVIATIASSTNLSIADSAQKGAIWGSIGSLVGKAGLMILENKLK